MMGERAPVTETRGGENPGDIQVDPEAVRHAELLWLTLDAGPGTEAKETPAG